MSGKRYHIISRGSGWVLLRESANRAYKYFTSKEEAKEQAERFRAQGFDIVIHRNDATVEQWLKAAS
jgi:basic membrane lipoprotein Med (substrate-binding protein (PBP1-ABC) superfamily)